MIAAPQIRTAFMDNLKTLHLSPMRLLRTGRATSGAGSLSYEQYLLELSEREYEARRRNRIATLSRESGLPREKTMANFDLKRLPTKRPGVGQQRSQLKRGGPAPLSLVYGAEPQSP